MYTCRDVKDLQKRIQANLDAINKTVPVLMEAMDELDEAFAIEQAENLQSQTNGLRSMLEEAKERGVSHLVMDASEF